MPRRALLLSSLAMLLVTAGCGRDADRAQVRTTAERFYAAVQHKDGATACGQLSSDAAHGDRQGSGRARWRRRPL